MSLRRADGTRSTESSLEMRAHIQSVAIWFLLVTGSFTVTQSGSLSIGAEPSKRQGVANAQYEPERLLERDVRRFIYTHPGLCCTNLSEKLRMQ